MRVSFATDAGDHYTLDVDPQIELENIMALLEAESDIPASDQSIHFHDEEMKDPKKTLEAYGVKQDDLLLLRRKVYAAGRTVEQDSEMFRLQFLGNPQLMDWLQQTNPELANAARTDPARFGSLLPSFVQQQREETRAMELARAQAEANLGAADEFDVEAQKRIEEAIRQERVMENLEHAMEYNPENFGRVTMLYIDVEVNGHKAQAFVDSGAQATIMSPQLAEECGIMRLLDKRFAGIARGVGTAKILGRVHSAQIKLGGDLFLPCSFTIMEGRGVDLLFGLDMLKRYQACIDLDTNALVIQGRKIRFLDEHELPASARIEEQVDEHGDPVAPPVPSGASMGAAGPSTEQQPQPQPRFPGVGNTLGGGDSSGSVAATGARHPASSVPSSAAVPRSQHGPRAGVGSGLGVGGAGGGGGHPEANVQALMSLGASRQDAERILDAAGGNVEVAASLLFQG